MDTKKLIENLEEWHENAISELCADDQLTCDDLCGCRGDCIVLQAIKALRVLAAYEDTGLTPEKVKQLVDAIRKHEVVFLTEDQLLKSMLIKVDGQWTDFTIAELQDFLRAKREDRLVVLPYKAADKDSRFYLTRLQSLSATEKNAFLMGKWGPAEQNKEG